MSGIGSLLLLFGLGSIVLSFFNMEFAFMSWIYMWGEGPAWAIKIVAAIAGAALMFFGREKDGDAAQ